MQHCVRVFFILHDSKTVIDLMAMSLERGTNFRHKDFFIGQAISVFKILESEFLI